MVVSHTNKIMRKNLKKIVEEIRDLSRKSKLELDVLTKGWIFIFGLVDFKFSVSNSDVIEKDLKSHFVDEIFILKERFPELYSSYLLIRQEISIPDFNQITLKIITCLESKNNQIDNWIGWAYQYLKKTEEKEAFRKSLNHGNKIADKELLLTTQFFTESYMISYLLNTSFSKNQRFDQLRLIDPACGGCNFLTYGFDYFFKYYKRQYPDLSNKQIVSTILNEHLFGYDLDENLTKIGRLSLFLKASKYAIIDKSVNLNIYNGLSDDKFGFLIKQNLIGFSSRSKKAIDLSALFFSTNKSIIIATNPPFMGIRNMDTYLKNYLQSVYPLSKGDLCAAFIEKCIGHLKAKDIFAVVAQNTWLYLKNFKNLRKYLLDNVGIYECIDLGDNAFYDINGSKTSVALTVFTKEKCQLSSFFNLRSYSTKEKEIRTRKRKFNSFEKNVISQEVFLKNEGFEVDYMTSIFLRKKIKSLKKYGDYATPMQGTSTGNNNDFVKYTWERPDNKNWRLVSKGGSYCKWSGLNIYVVKWGKNASFIKNNSGSAVRNLDKVETSQLVYSDTGTSGINVRLKISNQVFIASGPGIQINEGNVYCHLAFLNSRIATFFMRILSPKLTISAGYISKIPIPHTVLFSDRIETESRKCVSAKKSYLKNKLINFEYQHFDFNSISNLENYLKSTFLNDLELELHRLKCEYEIENLIGLEFGFKKTDKELIEFITGIHSFSIISNKKELDIKIIDKLIYNYIDVNCQYTGNKYKDAKVGCEGILERLSHEFGINPTDLFGYISQNVNELKKTISRFYYDFLHKIFLKEIGFSSITKFSMVPIQLNVVLKVINRDYNQILKTFDNEKYNLSTCSEWMNKYLSNHHSQAFRKKPLFLIEGNSLVITPIDNDKENIESKKLATIL